MCEKLVSVHSHFVKWLTELSREISDYHHTHKDKYKSNVSPLATPTTCHMSHVPTCTYVRTGQR